MKSSLLDKVSNISGFLYLRFTVRKIVINTIINRAIILELILVNATITFQSKQRVSQSCVSKYSTINKVLNVYESKDCISHFLQKHNENCFKKMIEQQKTVWKSCFSFFSTVIF